MSLMSDILSSNNPAIDTEIIEDMCSFFQQILEWTKVIFLGSCPVHWLWQSHCHSHFVAEWSAWQVCDSLHLDLERRHKTGRDRVIDDGM